jgi:hypothetical protein
MGRKRDDAFILGAEPLEPESAGAAEERNRSEPERRNAFAVAAETAVEGRSPAPVTWRSSSRLLAGLGLATAVVAVIAILAIDGGEERPTVEPTAAPPPPEAVVEPALSQPHRPLAAPREPRRRAPRPRPSKPKKRQSGRRQREPTSEPAPVAAPIGEPAAAPVRAIAPEIPPPSPSPPPPTSGGGPGGRSEFSFER